MHHTHTLTRTQTHMHTHTHTHTHTCTHAHTNKQTCGQEQGRKGGSRALTKTSRSCEKKEKGGEEKTGWSRARTRRLKKGKKKDEKKKRGEKGRRGARTRRQWSQPPTPQICALRDHGSGRCVRAWRWVGVRGRFRVLVWGLGLGFRVQGLGFRVQGLGFRCVRSSWRLKEVTCHPNSSASRSVLIPPKP
jgi:hypothetical protein